MAYNRSREVSAAREFGERFESPQVIVLFIDKAGESLGYASWGKTKELCDETKRLADVAFDAIFEHLGNE